MVFDRAEYARTWLELHAQELAALHEWPVAKARSVIAEGVRSGRHGFWNEDPVFYWDWKRRYGR